MDSLIVEIRRAAHRLVKHPLFTVTALLSLALGIGANVTIFCLIRSVLVEGADIRQPQKLVQIFTSTSHNTYGQFAYPDFEDLRDDTGDVFESLTASVIIIGQADLNGSVEAILGEAVSGGHFPMLGLQPALGRTLTADDDLSPGAHPVAMISHSLWRRSFAADPRIVGRDLRINGASFTIVGVAPEGYSGSMRGFAADFYAPAMMYDVLEPDTREILQTRGSHRFFVNGRLRDGVSVVQAQAAIDRVAEQFRRDLGWRDDSGFLMVPRSDIIVYPPLDRFIRASGWLLGAVVALILLTVCTNLAGFILARNLDRIRDMAIHLALGARHRALMVQVLAETTLLALGGGVAGTLGAAGALAALARADLPLPIPIRLDLGVDLAGLSFGLVVTVVTGFVLGLVPMVHNRRLGLTPALKDVGAGSGSSRRRVSARNGMVATQVAVSLVLLIGAGLFLRSLQAAQSVDPGFGARPAGLLTIALSPQRYDQDEGRRVMQSVVERLAEIPGVGEVGMTHNLQLRKTGRETMNVLVDGVEPPSGRSWFMVDKAYVDAGFFQAVDIPILHGRSFDLIDRQDAQPVCIVSEAMAAKFWPGESAVGRVMRREDGPDLRVVGIARDTRVLELSEAPRAFIYLPFSQSYSATMLIIASTRADADETALQMVAAVREVDPEIIVFEPSTMERHLGFVLLPVRLSAGILVAFALLAVALSSFGLYGIVSYSVAQRTREVGIRLSVGASVTEVALTLMKGGLKLVMWGGVAGLAAALLLSRAVRGLLFGVQSLDVATFVVAPLILTTVAVLAASVAARRVSRINPVDALKSE